MGNNPYAGSFIIVFILSDPGGPLKICGIFVDPSKFVRETLGPRIQSSIQDKFVISVYHNGKGVYSGNIYTKRRKVEFEKPLWLLAGFNLGIQMKDETIEELVKKRSTTNILLSIVMDIFLFSGAWFLYRNVKKEMRLARIKSDLVSNVSHEIRTPPHDYKYVYRNPGVKQDQVPRTKKRSQKRYGLFITNDTVLQLIYYVRCWFIPFNIDMT